MSSEVMLHKSLPTSNDKLQNRLFTIITYNIQCVTCNTSFNVRAYLTVVSQAGSVVLPATDEISSYKIRTNNK